MVVWRTLGPRHEALTDEQGKQLIGAIGRQLPLGLLLEAIIDLASTASARAGERVQQIEHVG